MNQDPLLTIIGRAELVTFPVLDITNVPAKVDTGADGSSIWASNIVLKDEKLQFTLFGIGSQYYTGKIITLEPHQFKQVIVENSFGHKESRYVIRLSMRLLGRRIRARFTLADRSQKLYPILLGRRLLHNKFLVDVTKGQPLHEEERLRRKTRQATLHKPQGDIS